MSQRVDYLAILLLEMEDTEDDVDHGSGRRSRRQVARSATQMFLREFRDSMRDVRGSLRENWLRPKSSTYL